MIVFNTLKKAQHYVRYRKHAKDFSGNLESRSTYIDGCKVLERYEGDGCGCGCDTYRFCYITVIGRIKPYDTVSKRDSRLKSILAD